MILILLYLIKAIILAFLSHEGGHYFTAKVFNRTINFRIVIGKLFNIIPIPRGIWNMPLDISKTKQKIIASAGFLCELIAGLLLLLIQWPYLLIVWFIHIVLYPFYAGEANDFKWFK